MKTITLAKLNKLYEIVNMQSRQGLISKMKLHFIEVDKDLIQFEYHPTIGRKGTWMINTEVEVRHIDDKDLGYGPDKTF